MLKIKKLNKIFCNQKIINDVSFCVKMGEVVGLIGPNGSGKSTLFNIISGLLKPDSGKVLLDEINIVNLETFQVCRKRISRTFQSVRLFDNLDVMANLKLAKGDFDFYKKLIKLFNLSDYINTKVSKLSFGQRKLLELIRVLGSNNKVILLDEPFPQINSEFTKLLINTIMEISAKKIIIIADHDLRSIIGVSSRILIIKEGNIVDRLRPNEQNISRIQDNLYVA